MSSADTAIGLTPPLSCNWRIAAALRTAVTGGNTLYGITSAGRVVALQSADGTQRWASAGQYATRRLAIQNSRLFAYRIGDGLVYLDDNGSTVSERLAVSFTAAEDTNMCTPVVDDRFVYMVVNQGLGCIHQDRGLQYGLVLSDVVPHTVTLVASRDIVVIDGKGVPTRYHVGDNAFETIWNGRPHGINAGQTEHPYIITGNRLILGLGQQTLAYDLRDGSIAWQVDGVPAGAFVTDGQTLYVGFVGAALCAIRVSDGAVLWQRQYLYTLDGQRDCGMCLAGTNVYFGVTHATNPDGAVLMACSTTDGSFTWLSRAAAATWAAGMPLFDGTHVFTYGAPHTGAYSALPSSPRVTPDRIQVSPRPLRGPASGFGGGTVEVDLPVSAHVSVAAWRELRGLGAQIVGGSDWSAGNHQATWQIATDSGYTDSNQFGYILVDVRESAGLAYTQTVLLPVNTFPDILRHWAKTNIEIMAYNKYVNGYADQTFQPDNLVTRAESSTIIAKTLGLQAPSAGFRTKFTDIGGHWARNFIMALEERGIVGGFAEPDGTFTFRPELNMTRAEEARIVVRAYAIAPAPQGFRTRFIDIAGHWAEPDIKALEAAGYVNGFQEPDGRYTYRPEQNLTRAELCTMVVRIRRLSR